MTRMLTGVALMSGRLERKSPLGEVLNSTRAAMTGNPTLLTFFVRILTSQMFRR